MEKSPRKPDRSVRPLRFSLILILLLFLIVPVSVLAHAQPVQIFPKPGSAHQGTLDEIRLIFDQPVQADASIRLFVQGTAFTEIAGIVTQQNPDEPEQIFAPLPHLPADTYSVQWQAAARDGHPLTGQFSFATGSSVWDVIEWWWVGAIIITFLFILLVTKSFKERQNGRQQQTRHETIT
jgi:methionine-rich copper-binding protein CopC